MHESQRQACWSREHPKDTKENMGDVPHPGDDRDHGRSSTRGAVKGLGSSTARLQPVATRRKAETGEGGCFLPSTEGYPRGCRGARNHDARAGNGR